MSELGRRIVAAREAVDASEESSSTAVERASWQRPPFEPGNGAGLRHGAYATLRLGARTAELADELRSSVPGYRPSDEVGLRLLALSLARLEAAEAAIEAAAPGDLKSLRDDMRGWTNTARRLLQDLAMSPTSRARLGVDVAQVHRAMTLTELAAEADEERRRGGGS